MLRVEAQLFFFNMCKFRHAAERYGLPYLYAKPMGLCLIALAQRRQSWPDEEKVVSGLIELIGCRVGESSTDVLGTHLITSREPLNLESLRVSQAQKEAWVDEAARRRLLGG